jgi:hypothetical protein
METRRLKNTERVFLVEVAPLLQSCAATLSISAKNRRVAEGATARFFGVCSVGRLVPCVCVCVCVLRADGTRHVCALFVVDHSLTSAPPRSPTHWPNTHAVLSTGTEVDHSFIHSAELVSVQQCGPAQLRGWRQARTSQSDLHITQQPTNMHT